MTIDYNVNIVTALFASDVAADADYESPGNFGLPATFVGTWSLDPSSTFAASHQGTGYVVGDVITLTGGTHSTAAEVRITGIVTGTGAVTTFQVLIPGSYTVLPSNPVSTSGGTGTGFEITAQWQGYAAQRLLTFIEIMRSYLAEVTSVYEAKLLQTIMRRMAAEIRFGYTYSATNSSANAKSAALNYLAGDGKSLTGSNLDHGFLGVQSQVGSGY